MDKKLYLENRIQRLKSRTNKKNYNIIRKLQRQLRNLVD